MKTRIVMFFICWLVTAGFPGNVFAQADEEAPAHEAAYEQHHASGSDMLSTAIVGTWQVIKYDSENRILTGQAIFSADGTLVDSLSLFGSANEWKVQNGRMLLLKPESDSGKSVDAYSVALLGDARINLARGHDAFFLQKTMDISRVSGPVVSPVKTMAGSSLTAGGTMVTR